MGSRSDITSGRPPPVPALRLEQCERWIKHWRRTMLGQGATPNIRATSEDNMNQWLEAWLRSHTDFPCENCMALARRTAKLTEASS